MPITQIRMIALATAARDYKQAYELTRAAIEVHFDAANNSEESWPQALNAVLQRTKPSLLLADVNSAAIIEVEHAHFKSFRGRNNRAAKSARKRRQNLTGIIVKPMEPAELITNISGTNQNTTGLNHQHDWPRLPPMPQSQTHAPRPKTMLKAEPDIIRIHGNTDAQQVQSDSDLFDIEPAQHESAEVDETAKAKILRDLDTLQAQREYAEEEAATGSDTGKKGD